MEEDTRAEIIKFRKKLDQLNGKEFSWTYTPVPEFEEKENYPLDFQIFMEEIGVFCASIDPHMHNNPFQLFRLEVPRALNTCFDDYESDKTNLFILPNEFTDNYDQPYGVDPVINGKQSDYFKIFQSIGLRKELVRKLLKKQEILSNETPRKTNLSETDLTAFKRKILETVKTTLQAMLTTSDVGVTNTFFVKGLDIYHLSRTKDLARKLGVSSKMIETAFATIVEQGEELFSANYWSEDQFTMFHHRIIKSGENLFLYFKQELYWGAENTDQLFVISEADVGDLMLKLKAQKQKEDKK